MYFICLIYLNLFKKSAVLRCASMMWVLLIYVVSLSKGQESCLYDSSLHNHPWLGTSVNSLWSGSPWRFRWMSLLSLVNERAYWKMFPVLLFLLHSVGIQMFISRGLPSFYCLSKSWSSDGTARLRWYCSWLCGVREMWICESAWGWSRVWVCLSDFIFCFVVVCCFSLTIPFIIYFNNIYYIYLLFISIRM